MYDFDLLEKKCRRYRLKRFVWIVAGILFGSALLGAAAYYAYTHYYVQSAKEKEVFVSPLKKDGVKKQQQPRQKPKKEPTSLKKRVLPTKQTTKRDGLCYAMQMMSFRSTPLADIYREKDQMQRELGFSCFVKKRGAYRVIRCNVVPTEAQLAPFISRAKQKGVRFIVTREICSYAEAGKLQQKVQQPRKTIAPIAPPKTMVVEREQVASKPQTTLHFKKVDIQKLLKLFEQRKTYALALRIAQKYYDKKEYKKSLLWAKKANKIDREDARSWILSAKARYMLGNKKAAKEILRFYLNYQNSAVAKELLQQWSKKE